MKYTVPATLVVTTAALGNLPLSINVAASETDGTIATVVDDELVVDVTTLVGEIERLSRHTNEPLTVRTQRNETPFDTVVAATRTHASPRLAADTMPTPESSITSRTAEPIR
jgi:hypothetical protein